MTTNPPPVDLDRLDALAADIAEQDNLATADPIFVVQDKRRIYGLSDDYAEGYTEPDEDHDESVGYIDVWEWVQPFLTRNAAIAYIEANHYNLTDPRLYVASAHRNSEWQLMRGQIGKLSAELRALRAENERLRAYAPHPFDDSLPTYAALIQEHAELESENERLRAVRDAAVYVRKAYGMDAEDNTVADDFCAALDAAAGGA